MSDRPLDELLAAMTDGELTAADQAVLNALLRDDPSQIDAYLDALALHGLLRAEFGSEDAVALAAPAAPLAPRSAAPRGPGVRFPMPLAAYALAAALLIAAAIVAIYVYSLTPDSRPLPPDSAPVATVIDAAGTLVVNDTVVSSGDEIRTGPISLDTGFADFRLHNGVTVRLTGPTQLTVHGPMAATLTRGSATFDCPPGAKGYTVNLPDGSRIVDLGTAFRVEIDDDGRCLLRVTQGRVAWSPAGDGVASEIVHAGHVIGVVAGRANRLTSYPIAITNPSFEADRNPDATGAFASGNIGHFGSEMTGWTALSSDPAWVAVGFKDIDPAHLHPRPHDPATSAQALSLMSGSAVLNVTDTPWASLRPGDRFTLTVAMGMRHASAKLNWNERTFIALTDAPDATDADSAGSIVARSHDIAHNPATGTQFGDGTFADYAFTHVVTAADIARPGRIGILILSVGAGGSDHAHNQSFFDHVRLDVALADEPAAPASDAPDPVQPHAGEPVDRPHDPRDSDGPRSEK